MSADLAVGPGAIRFSQRGASGELQLSDLSILDVVVTAVGASELDGGADGRAVIGEQPAEDWPSEWPPYQSPTVVSKVGARGVAVTK